MSFLTCFKQCSSMLMEGALGERLKREYGLQFDEIVGLATMIYKSEGEAALKTIWKEYIDIAHKYQLPFLATTPTRRANYERVREGGYDETIIRDNVKFLRNIAQTSATDMYIGGLMGCRGDAYTGEGTLSVDEARDFHKWQVEMFCQADVDFLYAGIMPVLSEAMGMAQAMGETGVPYIISFTIQGDGRLIDGTTISDAISYIDAKVNNPPTCYMTNCVHPKIVYEALTQPFNKNDIVQKRFLGIQANTSPLSYAELDGAVDLKYSEPNELARYMLQLREISKIKIFGGCCGTDAQHMEQVAKRVYINDKGCNAKGC